MLFAQTGADYWTKIRDVLRLQIVRVLQRLNAWKHAGLTNTIITQAAVGGPGRPEDLAGEAVLEFDHLTLDDHFLCARRRSVRVGRSS